LALCEGDISFYGKLIVHSVNLRTMDHFNYTILTLFCFLLMSVMASKLESIQNSWHRNCTEFLGE
jgi:hypothetical protein